MKNLGKLVAVVVLCGMTGIAAAEGGDSGDSSMNPYTGDSWAALQGGGHNLGELRGSVTVRIAKPREEKTPAAAPAEKAGTTRLATGGISRSSTWSCTTCRSSPSAGWPGTTTG